MTFFLKGSEAQLKAAVEKLQGISDKARLWLLWLGREVFGMVSDRGVYDL